MAPDSSQQNGIGFWYLHLLHTEWGTTDGTRRDWTDVLLGIYFACRPPSR